MLGLEVMYIYKRFFGIEIIKVDGFKTHQRNLLKISNVKCLRGQIRRTRANGNGF